MAKRDGSTDKDRPAAADQAGDGDKLDPTLASLDRLFDEMFADEVEPEQEGTEQHAGDRRRSDRSDASEDHSATGIPRSRP